MAKSSKGLILTQRKYALKLIDDLGMLTSKSATTPMDESLKLSKDSGIPLAKIGSYKYLIGCLLYLINSRPDITFSIQH